MYGDTGVIRHLAQQMADQAAKIRLDAEELVRAADTVRWEGRAAQAMRERMAGRAVALHGTADQHDDAAQALRHHADRVDQLKELIADIGKLVSSLVEGAKSRLAELADKALDVARSVTPDPIDQMLAAFSPPPIGHKDWLDVPDQLPGVLR